MTPFRAADPAQDSGCQVSGRSPERWRRFESCPGHPLDQHICLSAANCYRKCSVPERSMERIVGRLVHDPLAARLL